MSTPKKRTVSAAERARREAQSAQDKTTPDAPSPIKVTVVGVDIEIDPAVLSSMEHLTDAVINADETRPRTERAQAAFRLAMRLCGPSWPQVITAVRDTYGDTSIEHLEQVLTDLQTALSEAHPES